MLTCAGVITIKSRAEPSRAEPSRAEPSRAEPSRAEPSRAEPSRAEPSRAEPSRLYALRPTFTARTVRRTAPARQVPADGGMRPLLSAGPAARRRGGLLAIVLLAFSAPAFASAAWAQGADPTKLGSPDCGADLRHRDAHAGRGCAPGRGGDLHGAGDRPVAGRGRRRGGHLDRDGDDRFAGGAVHRARSGGHLDAAVAFRHLQQNRDEPAGACTAGGGGEVHVGPGRGRELPDGGLDRGHGDVRPGGDGDGVDVRIGLDVGGAAVAAAYRSALSSAKALVFRYTVKASDRDGDGVSIASEYPAARRAPGRRDDPQRGGGGRGAGPCGGGGRRGAAGERLLFRTSRRGCRRRPARARWR